MVIHNAWRLDFNLSLSSFEANIRGTRNLIDFARSAEHAATLRFLFTSSVSSAFSWDKARGAYPEDIVKDAKYAVGSGYGESKYVAERVCADFTTSCKPIWLTMLLMQLASFKEWSEGDILQNRPDLRRDAERRLGDVRLGPYPGKV